MSGPRWRPERHHWRRYHDPYPTPRQTIATIVATLVTFAAIMAIAYRIWS